MSSQGSSDILRCSLGSGSGNSANNDDDQSVPYLAVGVLSILNGSNIFLFLMLLAITYSWVSCCDAKHKFPMIIIGAGLILVFTNILADVVTGAVLTLQNCTSGAAIAFVLFNVVVTILSIIAGVFISLIWFVGVAIKYDRQPDDDGGVQGAITSHILIVSS